MIAVLDASAFGPVVLAEENGQILPGLASVLAGDGVAVPAHWHVEVANLLLTAVRRNCLGADERQQAFETLQAVRVETDVAPFDQIVKESWVLASRHGLSMYDAAYLELALRLRLPLATHDAALIRAATSESLPLFGR